MKNFFKFLFVLIVMFISISLNPSDFWIKEIPAVSTIQAASGESVDLVANNLMGGEIYSYQEENNQNLSGNSPQIVSLFSENNFKLTNITQFNWCFIHNLSTNLKEVQQIRAP